jgi:hypothetical protein
MRKKSLITLAIILIVIIISVIILTRSSNGASKGTSMCIANHAELYIQLGCNACETQKKMFGENYKYLNVIDCFYEREKCMQEEIAYTPTWIINGTQYIGVQSIETLKNLTGC